MSLPPLSLQTLARATDAAQQIIDRVQAAGIQGLGGGCYPTAEKLNTARDSTARDSTAHERKALIINGLQSEPDNDSDIALLQHSTNEVVVGAALTAMVCGATTIVLALPSGLGRELIASADSALATQVQWLQVNSEQTVDARQIHIPADHASGEEHNLALALGLIEELTAAVIAEPLTSQGVLCINLATSYAIARAVVHGEVLQQRMVTVNGAPQWVELGTAVAELQHPAWINGRHGGMPATTTEVVHPGTFCVSSPPPEPTAPCINCGACAPVCPAGLQPDALHKIIELGATPMPQLKLDACIECGACNAVCPSGLWLAQSYRGAKQVIANAQKRDALAAKAKARVDTRSLRLARQEAERTARLSNRADSGTRSW